MAKPHGHHPAADRRQLLLVFLRRARRLSEIQPRRRSLRANSRKRRRRRLRRGRSGRRGGEALGSARRGFRRRSERSAEAPEKRRAADSFRRRSRRSRARVPRVGSAGNAPRRPRRRREIRRADDGVPALQRKRSRALKGIAVIHYKNERGRPCRVLVDDYKYAGSEAILEKCEAVVAEKQARKSAAGNAVPAAE